MDELINKRRYKIGPMLPEPNFHRSTKFTSSIQPVFADNSLLKHTKITNSIKSHEKILQESKKSIQYSLSKHRLLTEKIESYTSEYFDYLRILHSFEEDLQLKTIAAVKIQKCFRAFKLKKFFEARIVGKLRPILKKNIEEMTIQAGYCFWNIGKNAGLCATKIQRWIRRVYFHRKIRRIMSAYLVYKEIKEYGSVCIIQQSILHFLNKEIVEILRRKVFISNKLLAIKRNLAVLKIKQVIKREKINVKLMKLKIRKYRRQNFKQKLRKRPKKNSIFSESSEKSIKVDNEKANVEEDGKSQTEFEKKLKLFQENEIRREKISMGYIAHNISRNKYRIYRTFKTKQLPEHNKTEEFKPITLKIPQKSLSPVRVSKWDSVKSDILKPTRSFLQYKIKEIEPLSNLNLPKDFRFRFRGKLLLPTISKKAKIRSKSENCEEMLGPKWKLSAQVKYENVESLYISERKNDSGRIKSKTPVLEFKF